MTGLVILAAAILVILAAAMWVLCGLATRRILHHPGGFWLGLLLGPLGVLIAGLIHVMDAGQAARG